MEQFSARQEGDHVLLIHNGRLLMNPLPWEAALEIAKAIMAKAKQAEEWAKRETIATDQAILQRAGANFGITSNPVILKEAIHRSQHDRDLRRYMPSIESKGVVGSPTVIGGTDGTRKKDT
jgi:hypothetical protein